MPQHPKSPPTFDLHFPLSCFQPSQTWFLQSSDSKIGSTRESRTFRFAVQRKWNSALWAQNSSSWSKLCIHLWSSGVQAKSSTSGFQLATGRWVLLALQILYFYSAGLIADFICHGCQRHSRQGRVISQKDDLETRQSQFWQYHGTYISRFTVWIIIFFNFYQAVC